MTVIPQRILILKPSSLGDIVHALPTVSAIRGHFPSAQIDWLIKAEWAELLEGNPHLDHVIPVNFQVRQWLSLIRRVRRGRYDLVVDLQGLFRTGLLAGLSGAPTRIGFKAAREGSSWFYTQRVELPIPMDRPWRLLDMHAVDRNLMIAKQLGADITSPSFDLPNLREDQEAIMTWLKSAGVRDKDRMIAMAPLSRVDLKSWPFERFIQVAQVVRDWSNTKVLLLGAASESWIVEKFASQVGDKLINLVGKTRIRHLGPLLRRCHVLLANDSAPIHIAAAVGCPVIAVFGPTHEGATGPYLHRRSRVVTSILPCRPCGKKACHHVNLKECLTSITVERVVDETKAILA